jgi:uncharacterized protein with PIN domain
MVEVLERNVGSKETRCENCDSKLRYMPSEVFIEQRNHDYLGDYDNVRVIKCPACGQRTAVN